MFPILKECPLFCGVDSETIDQLLGQSSYITNKYDQGDVIAHRDTAYSGLLILLEGSVRGEVTDNNGKRNVIDNIPSGQLIAPAFLFGGYNRLPIDVIANESCRVLTLHRGSLFEMMQDNMLILSNFIDIISNRANFFSRKIYALTVLMLREKIATYLCSQASNNGYVKVDLSKIAEVLNTTRAGIEQVLLELQRKGLIKVENGAVLILNRPMLETLSNNG